MTVNFEEDISVDDLNEGDMVAEYDQDSVEERVGEQNVGREEIVESVGEEDQRVVDRVEEDYDREEAQTLDSG